MIETASTYFPDLARRMAAAGITRSALARQLGYKGPAAVSRWLSGKSGARAETLQRCEAAYKALVAAQEARGATITPQGGPSDPTGAIQPLAGTVYLSVRGPLPPVVESAALEGGTIP